MTLLVSWAGVDTHGISSLYIAADSRISWQRGGHFDFARKVFAFKEHPDVLGFCGDALFPSIVMGQLVEMGDLGLLFDKHASCKEKFERIKEQLVQTFERYPKMVSEITADRLEIIHGSRTLTGKEFFCHRMTWKRSEGWGGEEIALPRTSGPLFVLGSGGAAFRNLFELYETGPTRGTSRAVFHCFCETLFSNLDDGCGGAPQLVGIIRKQDSVARNYGILARNERFVLGAMVDHLTAFDAIEWRNDLFEICDGGTKRRRDTAQRQPNPLRAN